MKKILSLMMVLIHHKYDSNFLNKLKKSFFIGLGVFISVLSIAKIGHFYNINFLIPPIAASFVIIFTSPKSPYARTKNIILGHVICALIGVIILNLMDVSLLSLAVALSLSIFFMSITDTIHPPGGATAILIMLTKAQWYFIFFPVGIAAILICFIAIGYKKLHKFIEEQHRIQEQNTI